MCKQERAIIRELRVLLDEVDELKEKMIIVETQLKITFVRDNQTNKWTIAMKQPKQKKENHNV